MITVFVLVYQNEKAKTLIAKMQNILNYRVSSLRRQMLFFLAYPVAGLLSILTLTVNVTEEVRYPGIRNLVKIDSDRDRALTCNLPPPSINSRYPSKISEKSSQ